MAYTNWVRPNPDELNRVHCPNCRASDVPANYTKFTFLLKHLEPRQLYIFKTCHNGKYKRLGHKTLYCTLSKRLKDMSTEELDSFRADCNFRAAIGEDGKSCDLLVLREIQSRIPLAYRDAPVNVELPVIVHDDEPIVDLLPPDDPPPPQERVIADPDPPDLVVAEDEPDIRQQEPINMQQDEQEEIVAPPVRRQELIRVPPQLPRPDGVDPVAREDTRFVVGETRLMTESSSTENWLGVGSFLIIVFILILTEWMSLTSAIEIAIYLIYLFVPFAFTEMHLEKLGLFIFFLMHVYVVISMWNAYSRQRRRFLGPIGYLTKQFYGSPLHIDIFGMFTVEFEECSSRRHYKGWTIVQFYEKIAQDVYSDRVASRATPNLTRFILGDVMRRLKECENYDYSIAINTALVVEQMCLNTARIARVDDTPVVGNLRYDRID